MLNKDALNKMTAKLSDLIVELELAVDLEETPYHKPLAAACGQLKAARTFLTNLVKEISKKDKKETNNGPKRRRL